MKRNESTWILKPSGDNDSEVHIAFEGDEELTPEVLKSLQQFAKNIQRPTELKAVSKVVPFRCGSVTVTACAILVDCKEVFDE